jgi:hypothetical protein
MTAAEPSGERLELEISVVFRYSSSVMAGLEDWDCESAGKTHRNRANAGRE